MAVLPTSKDSDAALQVPSNAVKVTNATSETAELARKRRKQLVAKRCKRMGTLLGKMCQAKVFLVIQYDDDETKTIYHSHPDEDWPKLSRSGIVREPLPA